MLACTVCYVENGKNKVYSLSSKKIIKIFYAPYGRLTSRAKSFFFEFHMRSTNNKCKKVKIKRLWFYIKVLFTSKLKLFFPLWHKTENFK